MQRIQPHLAVLASLLLLVAVAHAEPLEAPEPTKRDFYGDPLPQHALVRLGSLRFRPRTDVWAMDISPDGKLVATGTMPGSETDEVELWDAATGKQTGSLLAGSGTSNIISMAFSPDGTRLAVAHDYGVEIFDVKSRMSLKKLDTQRGAAGSWSLRWSPNGKLLASAQPSNQPKAWLWDAVTGKKLHAVSLPGVTESVAFSPDSKRLAVAARSVLRVFDTKTMKVLQSRDMLRDSVHSVAFSPDGKLLAGSVASEGGDKDFRVILWSTTGDGKRELACDTAGEVAFTPDGKTVFITGFSGPVIAWDVATGKKRYTLDDAGYLGRTLSLTADGRTLATGHRRIGLWDSATGKSLYKHNSHGSLIFTARFAPDGETILTGAGDGTVRAWNSATGRPLKVVQAVKNDEAERYQRGVYAIAHNGKFVAAGAVDGAIHVFDAKTLKLRGTMRPKLKIEPKEFFGIPTSTATNALVFLPSGDLLSSNGAGLLDVWDVAKRRHKRQLTPRTKLAVTPTATMVVSRDGIRLGVPDGEGMALWDLEKQQRLHNFPAIGVFTIGSAISADGKRLVTAVANPGAKRVDPGREALLRLWNCDTGKAVWTSTEPIGIPRTIAYSPDGKLIASSGHFNKYRVTVWSAADGQRLLQLAGHVDLVCDLSFSPDGKRLVSAGQDTTALVWDMTPALRKLKAAR